MARPIDAYTLNNDIVSWYNDTEDEKEKSILRRVMQRVLQAPTLTPPNEPLTLEELREMGGQPYWHVGLREESPPPHWNILDPFYAKRIEDYKYGENWIAYRRPPEGERTMKQNEPWWVSTKEFLPDEGEKVLIITKFGSIQDAVLRTYLPTGRQKSGQYYSHRSI